MSLKKSTWILGSLVVGSLGLMAYKITRSDSIVTFYTPAEIYANLPKFTDQVFRVSGLVVKGTRQWDAAKADLRFRMTDLQGHDFLVHYKGLPPDLFKEGQGVVVEGLLQAGLPGAPHNLEADLLMVKHSQVYDTKGDHAQMREMKLAESLLK